MPSFKPLIACFALLLAGCAGHGAPPTVNGFNMGAQLNDTGGVVITMPKDTASANAELIHVEISRDGENLYAGDIPWDADKGAEVVFGDAGKPVRKGDMVAVSLVTSGIRTGVYARFAVPKQAYSADETR